MVETIDTHSLQKSAQEHLWMHNRDWVQLAEEGGPTIIVEAEGVRAVDSDGKVWLDVNGGYCSVNAGYGRTEIAEAMREQMNRLTYFPQGTTTEPLIRLAEKIADITPGSLNRMWPVTGGSEANETAIKIAKAYQKRVGQPGRYKIISRKGSYHGATGGVMFLGSVTPDYEPAPTGMVYAPQPNPYRCERGGTTPTECAERCAGAIEELILFHGADTIAAVIAEPVSSSGAAVVPGDEYWPMLRDICSKYGVILIADEVICGFGRTGKMFASEHWDVVPDVMTIAKGITSSYLPLAAAVVRDEIADVFAGEDNIFKQALTFGGHPVTAAVALKNIEIIEREDLVQNSADVGAYFLEQLWDLKEEHPIVGDVRGIGLLLGIELVSDHETKDPFPPQLRIGERLTQKFQERGLFLRCGGSTINIGPPLCLTTSDVDEIARGIDQSLGELEDELADEHTDK